MKLNNFTYTPIDQVTLYKGTTTAFNQNTTACDKNSAYTCNVV